MDAFDLAILKQLQQDCQVSTQALGEEIGLSASACQRRIKKLTELGVIQKQVAILNPYKLPGFTTVIVDVELERGGEQALDELNQKLQNDPHVQQIYYTAGYSDFTVIMVAKNLEEYDRLSRKLFMNEKNVKKFVSKVAITTPKVSLAIPLES